MLSMLRKMIEALTKTIDEAGWARWRKRRRWLIGLAGAFGMIIPAQLCAQDLVQSARLGALLGASVVDGELQSLERIVIDPGHGGLNEGAIGALGVYEKHLTLQLSQHLADRLAARYPQLEVVLTREGDTDLSLSQRIEIANDAEANLFLSIHFNAALNPQAIGYESYWVQSLRPIIPEEDNHLTALLQAMPSLPEQVRVRHQAADESWRFARHFHAAMGARLQVMDRGIKRGNYTVLRKALVPAVVIELGFLSNNTEEQMLLDPLYQAKLVDALLSAIESYDADKKQREEGEAFTANLL